MKFKIITLSLLFIFASAAGIIAQDQQHFKMKPRPSQIEVNAGDNFFIYLNLEFEAEWYTYSTNEQISDEGIGPTQSEIFFDNEELLVIDGDIRASESHIKYDKGFEMDVETYSGNMIFEVPVKAQKDLNFASDEVIIGFYTQQCTAEKCLPPMEFKTKILAEEFAGEFEVIEPQKETAAEEATETVAEEEQMEEETRDEGLLALILISLTLGFAALLTPCVYPMIPITVSFFTKRAEQTKGKGLRDALIYALGIIFTFTFLGFAFSIILGPTGIQDFAKSPGVYLFIALLFIFFAFSLFGAYEIQLPTGMINKLDTKSRKGGGIGSVLLMSLVFSLASFSCTGPIVASALLGFASGEWFYPMISMIFFSSALALPFFILALVPSLMTSMPKSGGWMNNVKGVLGFIVLASSLYFISNAFAGWQLSVLSRSLFLAILAGIGFMTTFYVLGIFKLSHDSPVEKVGVVRLLIALAFATLTFYFISGLFGRHLGEIETYLPEAEAQGMVWGGGSTQQDKLTWHTDYDEALAQAKEQNKSVFIDFTGKKCTNCKKMEKVMFPKPEIQKRLKEMVRVKLITDIKEEPYISNQKFQLERFKDIAIPLYVIMSPEDKMIAKIAYTSDEEEFAEFLDKGIE